MIDRPCDRLDDYLGGWLDGPARGEFDRIKTNDVILPTSNGREVRIRCITQAGESQRILLRRLGIKIPTRLGEPK